MLMPDPARDVEFTETRTSPAAPRRRIGGLDEWRGILVTLVAVAHFTVSMIPGTAFTPAYQVERELGDHDTGVAAGLLTMPQLAKPYLSGWAVVRGSTEGTGVSKVEVSVAGGAWHAAALNFPTPGMALRNSAFGQAGWQIALSEDPGTERLVPVRVQVTAISGETRILDGGVRWNTPKSWLASVLWVPMIAQAAVDHFFVISGFLITLILIRTHGQPGYLRTFWVRRALRILPLAWLLIAMASLLLPGYRHVMPAYAFFVGNWVTEPPPGLGPMWSLAVEEQFYLVYPVLFWLLPRQYFWVMVGGLCLLLTAIRLHLPSSYLSGLYLVDSATHMRAIALAAGGWIALVREGLVPRPRVCAAVFVAWFAGWALWGGSAPRFEDYGRMGTLDTVVIAGAVALLWWMDRRSIQGPAWLRFVGVRCYGIYLLHVPLLITMMGLMSMSGIPLPVPVAFAVWATATLVAATLSYRYLEQPLLAVRPTLPWRRTGRAPIVTS
jgi:peptidoglycan/LPS O-acetylase OafA/YrhL